jgi:hypothetical protein
MKLDKPAPTSTVYVKVQEFRDGQYLESLALSVYDTTAEQVMKVIRIALENGQRKRKER